MEGDILMAKFYLIRHGKPDYTYGDTHGFIGHGHDLAPLKEDKIIDVIQMSKDERLRDAQIIIASPYTRALQTASIISKETGLDIIVEPDIREWQPDLTYKYKNSNEMNELYEEYIKCNGVYPINETKKWETKEQLKKRVMSVVNKYKDKYDKVIIVAHKMAFQSICNCGDMEPAEIFEINFK